MTAVAALLLAIAPEDAAGRAARFHFETGRRLERQDQHAWATEEFERAVTWDRDHNDARRALGMRREGDRWVRNPNARVATVNEREGEAADDVAREWTRLWTREGAELGAIWFDAGDARWALHYDPNHAGARAALGFAREGEGPWLTQDLRVWRNRLRDGWISADEGEPTEETTEVERACDVEHAARRIDWFLLESPHFTDAQLVSLTRHAEHSRVLFEELTGRTEVLSELVSLVYFQTEAQHGTFVDAFIPEGQRDFARGQSGLQFGPYLVEIWQGERDMDKIEDHTVHYVVHALLSDAAGETRPWLWEGAAWYFTTAMKGSIETRCVDVGGTGSGGGPMEAPADWAAAVRDMVERHADPDILAVFGSDFQSLTEARALKAWSLVAFLIQEYPDEFDALLSELHTNPEDDGRAAVEAVYDLTPRDLEERWRQWVRLSP